MRLLGLLLLWITCCGCGFFAQPSKTLTLATTTSTRDSGLLDVLTPKFEEETGIPVKVIAVGTGQALEMGRRGDVDVLLTHAPAAEEEFVAAGHGLERRVVMFNDFVLVGPKSDPDGASKEPSILLALANVAGSATPFVSRGDNSGTHMKEQALWEALAMSPGGPTYLSVGAGMAQTLRTTSEKQGYTLTDRATFLALQEELDLAIVKQGDPELQNVYAVIPLNPGKHPRTNLDGANRFADFLLQPETQETIKNFGVQEHGEPLFFPRAALQPATAPE